DQSRLLVRLLKIRERSSFGSVIRNRALLAAVSETQMQFHARTGIRAPAQHAPLVRHAEAQLRLRIVSNSAQLAAHELSEKRIDELKNRFAAAKIFGQRDRHTGSVAPGFGVVLENARVGETKSIDALLHVANQKTVRFRAFTAQRFDDFVLRRVDVLVF